MHRKALEGTELELVLVELPVDLRPKALKKQEVCLLDSVVTPITLEAEYECKVVTDETNMPEAILMFPDEEGNYRPIKRPSVYMKVLRRSEDLKSARANALKTQPRAPLRNLKLKWQSIEPFK